MQEARAERLKAGIGCGKRKKAGKFKKFHVKIVSRLTTSNKFGEALDELKSI